MLLNGLSGGVASGESSVSGDTLKPPSHNPWQRFEHCQLVRGEDGKPVELGRGATAGRVISYFAEQDGSAVRSSIYREG